MSEESNSNSSKRSQRRSSTRSIKRKKFYDEDIASAKHLPLPPSSKVNVTSKPEKALRSKEQKDSVDDLITNLELPKPDMPPTTPVPSVSSVNSDKKKTSKKNSKQPKRPKKEPGSRTNLGRWKPQDDLALITAVQQVNDLKKIYLSVKFTCYFTLQEIEERWYLLLYDNKLSKVAQDAIKQLHPEIVNSILFKAPFSANEEKILADLPSQSLPTIAAFQSLLNDNRKIFYPTRTARSLQVYWNLMKFYDLLSDQNTVTKSNLVCTFSDAEEIVMRDDQLMTIDLPIEEEMAVEYRSKIREMRKLKEEISKLQLLAADSVFGMNPVEFDSQTWAVLKGRLVRYLMRSKEISVGRNAVESKVDVDLNLEGPAHKVSRRQGIIEMNIMGEFFIANEGKRPIFVDGLPVLFGDKTKLNNNAIIEISSIRLIFLINEDLLNSLRSDGLNN